jgi:hypothetical protein
MQIMQASEPSLVQVAIAAFKAASPDVQAALVGNLGIVVGALVTVIVTAYIATRQFRHERVEKAKDRALEVKKEVLLEGVRGAQQLLSGIGAFSNMTRSPEQIVAEIQQGIGRITVAGAVGNLETVAAGKDLVDSAGPIFMDLIARRKPLDDIKQDIDITQQEIDRLLADNRIVLELQRSAIAADRPTEAKFHGETFQRSHEYFLKLAAKRDEHSKQLEALQMPLIKYVLDVQLQLGEKLRRVIARVRVDINIDDTPDGYLAASYLDTAKFKEKAEQTLDGLLNDPGDIKPAGTPPQSSQGA